MRLCRKVWYPCAVHARILQKETTRTRWISWTCLLQRRMGVLVGRSPLAACELVRQHALYTMSRQSSLVGLCSDLTRVQRRASGSRNKGSKLHANVAVGVTKHAFEEEDQRRNFTAHAHWRHINRSRIQWEIAQETVK